MNPVLGGRHKADGVAPLIPDHVNQHRDVLRAMLAGKLARTLQVLLNVVPGHAWVRMDDSGCDDGPSRNFSLEGTQPSLWRGIVGGLA